jgi:hypothetical protein
MNVERTLTAQVVDRAPLESGGYSGNIIERVTLQDGRRLILKRVSPEWDWLSRATNDNGRIVEMWRQRLFERMPYVVDHTTVTVEDQAGAWSVFMDDVSEHLFPGDRRINREEVKRILSAAADVHDTFWGESFPELCSLEDRYRILSPMTARAEHALGSTVGDTLDRGWEMFSQHAPSDFADVILQIAEEPKPLCDRLRQCKQTLIHGDLRLGNLGLREDRVVLVDWGDRTGTAPPAVDLMWLLGFDAARLEMTKEEVVDEFTSLYGDRFEPEALALSFLGGCVHLGCHLGLGIFYAEDDRSREKAFQELDWWVKAAERGLEVWSPI